MANEREVEAMRLAIALSAHGLGTTSPNPPVGCVILDTSGQIVGTGYHHRKGEPHAEALALAAAGRRAAGGTAVVTLEPCNHIGRTPACRQALLDAGVARVVIALIDPTSRGEGGAAILRSAGVDVEVDALADEARLVLGPWLAALAAGRPVVTAAYAVSDDADGLLDQQVLAELRTSADAVMHQNRCVEEGVPGSHGQGTLELPSEPVAGAPADLLKALFVAGVRTLLLDGGKALAEEYATAGLVDRMTVYMREGVGPLSSSAGVVPAGFRIERVAKFDRHVIVDAVPSARG